MTKEASGASASRPGSREPSPSVSAASGFDPSRFRDDLRRLRDSQTVAQEGVRAEVEFGVLCDVLVHGHDAAAELARAREIIERVRDVDYWEGGGEALIEWVTLGYVERGDGTRENNLSWKPLRDRDGAEGGDANAAPVPQDRQARAEGIAPDVRP